MTKKALWRMALGGLLMLACSCSEEETPGKCSKTQDCNNGQYCDTDAGVCRALADWGADSRVPDMGLPDAGPDGADGKVADLSPGEGKLPSGEKCTSGSQCASGYCTDQVCCESDCSGTCRACDLSGSVGTCAFIQQSEGPQAECPGDSDCGNGSCDGSGACAYPKAGQSCKADTCAKAQVTSYACDSAHQCKASSPSTCPGFYECNSAGTACQTGCKAHTDCITGSLCDRSQAHKTGDGACVDPLKVVTVGASSEIADELSKISSSKPYLAIPPKSSGSYTKELTLDTTTLPGGTVFLVGTGTSASQVVLDPWTDEVPAIHVKQGMTVTVQGLTLKGATGAIAGSGITCEDTSSAPSSLTVVETKLSYNTTVGIISGGCDVVLRRNEISNNLEGGIYLFGGSCTVVNNILVYNGTSSSSFGGAIFISTSPVLFYNNTIAYNQTKAFDYPGVQCGSYTVFPTLYNSIIWKNTVNATQVYGCQVEYSDVDGGASGTGNLSTDPFFKGTSFSLELTSPCIDKGTSVTNVTAIDIAGAARPQGAGADMGAYEVK